MIRCTVYDGDEKLFHLDGDNVVVVACATRQMVRTEYPMLGDGLEWQFETVYPEIKLHEPPEDILTEWDEHVIAARTALGMEA